MSFTVMTPQDGGKSVKRPRYSMHAIEQRHEMSSAIESFKAGIDNRVYYRFGWPRFPPLQMQTLSSKGVVKNGRDILNNVRSLLETRKVQAKEINFVYRVPHDMGYVEDPVAKFLTLLITLDIFQGIPTKDQLLWTLHRYLEKEVKPKNLMIEFVDPAAEFRLQCLGIVEKEVIEAWNTHSEAILNLLKEEKYMCLEVLRCGITDDPAEFKPTIAISSSTANSEQWWDPLHGARFWVMKYLAENNLDFNFDVFQLSSYW